MKDLVQRLRDEAPKVGEPENVWCSVHAKDLREAADLIESQVAEIAKLTTLNSALTDKGNSYIIDNAKLTVENARLRIRGSAYEAAFGIAYQATYQSHNGHWDSTMQGGAGCRECIRAREARENCDAELRRGLEALAARAQEKQDE